MLQGAAPIYGRGLSENALRIRLHARVEARRVWAFERDASCAMVTPLIMLKAFRQLNRGGWRLFKNSRGLLPGLSIEAVFGREYRYEILLWCAMDLLSLAIGSSTTA